MQVDDGELRDLLRIKEDWTYLLSQGQSPTVTLREALTRMPSQGNGVGLAPTHNGEHGEPPADPPLVPRYEIPDNTKLQIAEAQRKADAVQKWLESAITDWHSFALNPTLAEAMLFMQSGILYHVMRDLSENGVQLSERTATMLSAHATNQQAQLVAITEFLDWAFHVAHQNEIEPEVSRLLSNIRASGLPAHFG